MAVESDLPEETTEPISLSVVSHGLQEASHCYQLQKPSIITLQFLTYTPYVCVCVCVCVHAYDW